MLENTHISLEQSKNIKLSKNFTLYEFLKSDIALRLGIDNSLPIDFLPRIKYLVDNVLQPLRDEFGRIRVTSGYRSVLLCEAIGSSSRSNHAFGLAADIEPIEPSVTLLDIMEYIESNLPFKELIAEYMPSGWVHVAAQDGANFKSIKLKDNEHNYTRVNFSYIKGLYNG